MVLLRKLSGYVIPRIVWNLKYNYRIHNRRLLYSPFFILPNGGLLTVPFFCGSATQRRTTVGRAPLDE